MPPTYSKTTISSNETQSVRVPSVNLSGKAARITGDLYIDGDLTLGDNASLKVEGNLYLGGNFSITANNKNKAATLNVKKDVIAKNSVNLHDLNLNIGGNMFVPGLTIEKVASDIIIGSSLYVKGNLNIGNLYGNKGQLTVTNDIVADNISLNHPNLNLNTGGEVLVTYDFYVKNNANIVLTGGLEVGRDLNFSNNVVFNFSKKLYLSNSLVNNGQMLLIKSGGTGSGTSYKVDIGKPENL